ncbi:hypothetical protein OS493_005441 [Desmophyllum pertusum]|uniref:Uncharacterized protein n=1 Tax=Desmophyllum pertusum TaxID=174260 RepID=A0A9X0CMG6_9CNID|nr:hypothetical protein OS493_005441 [Desmophyllum pertusum]
MATKKQIRELLKAELRPINVQSSNEKLPGPDFDLKEPKEGYPRCARKQQGKQPNDSEELAQYLRRDCLEISPRRSLVHHIVKSIGEALDLEITDSDIRPVTSSFL